MHQMVMRGVQSRSRWLTWAVPLLSVLLFLGLALRIMNYEMRRDEWLFVPPARLLDDQALYRDFFYNHVPGSAWLFHFLHQLLGTDYLLLSGRLGVLLAWVVFVAAIGWVSFKLTRSQLVSWCIVVLTCANELLLTQTGMAATNNFLPLPFAFLGVGLFLLGACNGNVRPGLIFASGFCLSLACVFKINAIAFIPPVAIAAFFLPRSMSLRRRLSGVVAWLLAGGLIGALPIFVYLVIEPRLFLANILEWHIGAHDRFWQAHGVGETDAALSLSAKILLARNIWFGGTVAVPIAAVLALLFTRMNRPRGAPATGRWPLTGAEAIVLGALALSILVSFLPTPGFPQYYAPPLVCLPLGLALLFRALQPDERARVLPVLVAASVVVLVCELPRVAQFLPTATDPGRWTAVRIHDEGVELRQALDRRGVTGKVATLSPLYPLEGGLDVYAELATGPFAYRSADFVAPESASYYRMTSPGRIAKVFDADPPAAFLLGLDQELERPMLEYANTHGYVRAPDVAIADRYGSRTLYVRPGSSR